MTYKEFEEKYSEFLKKFKENYKPIDVNKILNTHNLDFSNEINIAESVISITSAFTMASNHHNEQFLKFMLYNFLSSKDD